MPVEMNARKIIKKYHGTKEVYEDTSNTWVDGSEGTANISYLISDKKVRVIILVSPAQANMYQDLSFSLPKEVKELKPTNGSLVIKGVSGSNLAGFSSALGSFSLSMTEEKLNATFDGGLMTSDKIYAIYDFLIS